MRNEFTTQKEVPFYWKGTDTSMFTDESAEVSAQDAENIYAQELQELENTRSAKPYTVRQIKRALLSGKNVAVNFQGGWYNIFDIREGKNIFQVKTPGSGNNWSDNIYLYGHQLTADYVEIS
jgi:hypothetical protein